MVAMFTDPGGKTKKLIQLDIWNFVSKEFVMTKIYKSILRSIAKYLL